MCRNHNGPHSWNTSRTNSWKCLYFQNVSWYERNAHLLPTTCKWCVKRSLFSLANWWHWILMHCLYNILQVRLLWGFFVYFFFCSWELFNCLASGRTRRFSLSFFTQSSNQWRRGGANTTPTNHPTCTTTKQQSILKCRQLAVFRRAPDIFQLA